MTRAEELEQIRTAPRSAKGCSSPNIILLREGAIMRKIGAQVVANWHRYPLGKPSTP